MTPTSGGTATRWCSPARWTAPRPRRCVFELDGRQVERTLRWRDVSPEVYAQARAGVAGWWVGGATAYHQWHPVSDPPVEHLAAIVRNANRFHELWGWFPMEGWLAAFERAGLARRDGRGWVAVEDAAARA